MITSLTPLTSELAYKVGFLFYVKKFFLRKKVSKSHFLLKMRLKDLIDNKIKKMRLLGFGAEKSH